MPIDSSRRDSPTATSSARSPQGLTLRFETAPFDAYTRPMTPPGKPSQGREPTAGGTKIEKESNFHRHSRGKDVCSMRGSLAGTNHEHGRSDRGYPGPLTGARLAEQEENIVSRAPGSSPPCPLARSAWDGFGPRASSERAARRDDGCGGVPSRDACRERRVCPERLVRALARARGSVTSIHASFDA